MDKIPKPSEKVTAFVTYVKQLEQEVKELKETNSKLESDLATKTSAAKNLDTELNSIKDEISSLCEFIVELKSSVEKAAAENVSGDFNQHHKTELVNILLLQEITKVFECAKQQVGKENECPPKLQEMKDLIFELLKSVCSISSINHAEQGFSPEPCKIVQKTEVTSTSPETSENGLSKPEPDSPNEAQIRTDTNIQTIGPEAPSVKRVCKKRTKPSSSFASVHKHDKRKGLNENICVCSKSFHKFADLQRHIKYFNKRRKRMLNLPKKSRKLGKNSAKGVQLSCVHCAKIFLSRNMLNKHRWTEHKLQECLRIAKTEQAEPEEGVFVKAKKIQVKKQNSPQAEKKSETKDTKLTHGQDLEKLPGYFCFCREAPFKTPATLKNHIKYRTMEKRFKCPKCPKKYLGANLLRYHLKNSHGYNPGNCKATYGCTKCGRVFPSLKNLISHSRNNCSLPVNSKQEPGSAKEEN